MFSILFSVEKTRMSEYANWASISVLSSLFVSSKPRKRKMFWPALRNANDLLLSFFLSFFRLFFQQFERNVKNIFTQRKQFFYIASHGSKNIFVSEKLFKNQKTFFCHKMMINIHRRSLRYSSKTGVSNSNLYEGRILTEMSSRAA